MYPDPKVRTRFEIAEASVKGTTDRGAPTQCTPKAVNMYVSCCTSSGRYSGVHECTIFDVRLFHLVLTRAELEHAAELAGGGGDDAPAPLANHLEQEWQSEAQLVGLRRPKQIARRRLREGF